MTPFADTVLVSVDADLQRRIQSLVGEATVILHVEDPAALERALHPGRPRLVLYDLRVDRGGRRVPELLERWPALVVIGFAEAGSEPRQEARRWGLFGILGLTPDRESLQDMVQAGRRQVALLTENRELRDARMDSAAGEISGSTAFERAIPLDFFTKAGNDRESVDTLAHRLVDSLQRAARASRVLLFMRRQDQPEYTLKAHVNSIPESRHWEFAQGDPLVRWLQIHAHMVAASTLHHIEPSDDRVLLRQVLEQFGAAVLIPLQGRNGLMGWVLLGQRATGIPYSAGDLEDLRVMADHISTTLENALLNSELRLRKSLAETLFRDLQTAIVAVGPDQRILWFNPAAQEMFEFPETEAHGSPVGDVDRRLADLMTRAFRDTIEEEALQWHDPGRQRTFSASLHILGEVSNPEGVVALVEDVTRERRLAERDRQIDRTAFWTELAASMAHEIRNPLVTIKTYAQLLPERYTDEEFRSQFREQLSTEVDRLNGIIDQIYDFSRPPALDFQRTRPHDLADLAMRRAQEMLGLESLPVTVEVRSGTPAIQVDRDSCSQALAHLIVNSMEAGEKTEGLHIRFLLRPAAGRGVEIAVLDNGPGIPEEIRDRVFSPFCTTKPRGMGLGVPLVQRMAVDHNADLRMDSAEAGTCVSLFFPVAQNRETPPSADSAPPREF